jgi:hypothetical protein
VRVANLDGTEHVMGDCCQRQKCRKCGGVEHDQGVYGGLMRVCERCDWDEFLSLPQPTIASVRRGLRLAVEWRLPA